MSKKSIRESMLDVQYIRAAINGHEVVAGVQPLCGANLVSLKVDGLEYIHYDRAALLSEEERFTGCFIMFPTPCRVPDGRYEFAGRTITQTKAGRPYAIHGLVRDEAFEFALTDGGCDLSLDITPDHPVHEGFPFPGRLSVSLVLVETGLQYNFRFENRGQLAAPVGFGLHPFWRIPGRRKDVYVKVPCAEAMVLENLVPTGGTEPVAGTEMDLRQGRCLEGLDLDTVFLARQGAEPATIEFRDLRKRLSLLADEVFTHQIVYCPQGEPFVCVENLTCAPNAVNLQSSPPEVSGFRVIGPGEALAGTTRFIVDDL